MHMGVVPSDLGHSLYPAGQERTAERKVGTELLDCRVNAAQQVLFTPERS